MLYLPTHLPDDTGSTNPSLNLIPFGIGIAGLNPLPATSYATSNILFEYRQFLPYKVLTGDGIELAIYVRLTMQTQKHLTPLYL